MLLGANSNRGEGGPYRVTSVHFEGTARNSGEKLSGLADDGGPAAPAVQLGEVGAREECAPGPRRGPPASGPRGGGAAM